MYTTKRADQCLFIFMNGLLICECIAKSVIMLPKNCFMNKVLSDKVIYSHRKSVT
jgi:hypothetical protein